jgi:hypothetical protein
MRGFIESLSLPGAISVMLLLLTLIGIGMDWTGHPNGEKVWSNFGSGFLAFVSGRMLPAAARKVDDGDTKSG